VTVKRKKEEIWGNSRKRCQMRVKKRLGGLAKIESHVHKTYREISHEFVNTQCHRLKYLLRKKIKSMGGIRSSLRYNVAESSATLRHDFSQVANKLMK